MAGLAVALAVAGCSSSSGSGGSSGSGSGSGSTTTYKIAYNDPNTGNDFHLTFQCGIVQAAKQLGDVDLSIKSASTFSSTAQIPVINAIAATRPQAVITGPTDATALVEPLKQVKAAGTKVIVYDTGLTDPTVASATVTSNNVAGGVAAAKELVKLIGTKGTVLPIDIAAGVVSTNNRAKGLIQELKKYPGIKVLPTQYDGQDATKDASIVNATLAAHPNLSAVVPVYNTAAEGVIPALKADNKIGKVKVVTFDADSVLIKDLKAGEITAVVTQQPYIMAKAALEDAVKAIKGEKIAVKDDQFPMPVITKDNVNNPKYQKEYYTTKLCT